jgi:hypothetical protein
MDGDDGNTHTHAVITFRTNCGRADLSGSSGPNDTRKARLAHPPPPPPTSSDYLEDICVAKSESDALNLARSKISSLGVENPSALVVVAKFTHVMKATDVGSQESAAATITDRSVDGVGLHGSSKRARWIVTFTEETDTLANLPNRIMNVSGSSQFEWAIPPSGFTSSIIVASDRAEAERRAKEVKEKKPEWQAVISKVKGQISTGKKRKQLEMARVQ